MNHNQRTLQAQAGHRNSDTSGNSHRLVEESVIDESLPLPLIYRLCHTLEAEGITYCHWKSNNAIDRSASGANDLDLLIRRSHAPRFTEILYRLGFKRATASVEKQLPGVQDYVGYDQEADRLIHVHAHYQLVLGHDMTKNYRLPIERPYLESAIQDDLFRIPAPEFEFIVFVIRMVLKHSTWDVILGRQGRLKAGERQELTWLQGRIDYDRVYDILQHHLPYISAEVFTDCIQALHPTCPIWTRVRAGQQLQARLQANARRPLWLDVWLKLWRRVTLAIRRRISRTSSKYRLESGGAMLAVVGGDGAGKSTVVDTLYDWLSEYFVTTSIHMGKPAWSWTTIAVRGILKIGNVLGLYPVETSFRKTLRQESPVSPGYPWLLRETCRARDRYLLYRKARRFAGKGGLVILDRFPLSQIQLMDGPQAGRFLSRLADEPLAGQFMTPRPTSRFARSLVKREQRYYDQMTSPDVLIVLRVDPEIAVERRTDEDPAFVRERNTEVWELDWANLDAHVIDGSKPKRDVLAEIKALVWSEL